MPVFNQAEGNVGLDPAVKIRNGRGHQVERARLLGEKARLLGIVV
jgi:hypothetical protein